MDSQVILGNKLKLTHAKWNILKRKKYTSKMNCSECYFLAIFAHTKSFDSTLGAWMAI